MSSNIKTNMIRNKATGNIVSLKYAKTIGLINNPYKFDLGDNVLVKDKGGNVRLIPITRAKNFIQTPEQKKFLMDKNGLNVRINDKNNVVKINDKYLIDKLNEKLDNAFNNDGEIKLNLKTGRLPVDKIYNEILKRINKTDKNLVIKVNNKYITLNQNNIKRFFKLVKQSKKDGIKYQGGAGIADSFQWAAQGSFDVSSSIELNSIVGRKQEGGGFFNYYTNYFMDLSKYQIYHNLAEFNKQKNTNCLIHSLELLGLNENKIYQLKQIVKSHIIPKIKLKKFCEDNEICIILKTENETKNRHSNIVYGDVKNECYELNLIGDHYFINDTTEWTSYAIKNFVKLNEEFKDKKKPFNDIIKQKNGVYVRDKNRFISSYNLVKLLLEHKEDLLNKISYNDLTQTNYYNENTEIETLEYNINDNTRINIYEERENKNSGYDIVFFDFETYNDNENLKHIPYLCVSKKTDEKHKKYYGVNCGKKMLDDLENDTILIAHNSSYDWTFLNKYLFADNVIMKGKSLINGKFKYHNFNTKKTINIVIKDSLLLIPMKLGKFGEMFNLKQEKEIMPYDIYNKENLEKRFINIDVIINYYKNKKFNGWDNIQINQFKNNVKKWNLINTNNEVDILEYSALYCVFDCVVLEEGYKIFRNWIYDITDLNIDEYLTIPSIVDTYLLKNGVYDGVYKLSGNVREFIQKCVVGGRTMLSDNKKWIVKKDIADFDGVSLYPSSMDRLGGYLKGRPKIINVNNENITYNNIPDFLNNYDGYFIQIEITKINKKRHMPLISYIDNNKRNWVDDETALNRFYYVDKTTLEDLIKYQQIEFKFIRGYYYDEGRNYKLKEIIKFLFNERLKKKKDKNPIEKVYKLMLNAAYGKSILKPIDDEIILINKKDKEKHLAYHFDNVKEYFEIENTNKICFKEYKTINNHFNNVSCGVEVLSMSKRIMNEVICIGEDLNLNIYYQDTDSIHIDYNQVETLAENFEKITGRKLIGKDLGQFHIDFELKGVNNTDSIKSKMFIGVGKKCYMDVLEGVNDKGEIVKGFHLRLKGIPEETINYHLEDNKTDAITFYEELHSGIPKELDLLCGGNACRFLCDNLTYVMRADFTRTIVF